MKDIDFLLNLEISFSINKLECFKVYYFGFFISKKEMVVQDFKNRSEINPSLRVKLTPGIINKFYFIFST